MQVQPYLSFGGRCEEAIEFYKKALNAEVTRLLRFKDNPQPTPECKPAPGTENKIMHAALRIGDTTVMATDGRIEEGKPTFQGISLSLTAINDAQAQRLFAALSDGGQVQMPLTKTFFSSNFAMVVDRFGVTWMIVAGPAQ
jgi:PhnB protein